MLAFLAKNSTWLLVVAAVVGFIFPNLSASLFPFLPAILFTLMLFTLAGMEQKLVIQHLKSKQTWAFALLHNVALTLLLVALGHLFALSSDLILALSAVGATGSLFATPAIARSVGLDPLPCMATTIATTLLMPVVIYLNLVFLQSETFSLDMVSYIKRLVIFIVLPMLISVLLYRFVPRTTLQRAHGKLAQVTIVLVFSFPLGLIGPFRETFNTNPQYALQLLLLGALICCGFFIIALAAFWHQGKEAALAAAITSGNRNVLLTWTVAGSFLGSEYLPLVGALQVPIYLQPLVVRRLKRYWDERSS
ncbi:hypothetical protein [Thaumasiovibrio subtropicus]|uniref:hypothetical protein n=1 Tax=Thaumasiovibrio subtropicus TaxID=1891207 RepID=UPI0018653147|nr:hypothetical protein [Thaumasiovibrio subtropicus]